MLKSLFKAPSIDWPNKFKRRAENSEHEFLREYYASGVPSADTPLEEVEFVALDFETTGLNPQNHGIVSIGLVPFTLNRIYLKKSKYWLVKPRKKMSQKSVTIHGITHSDLLDAPDLKDIIQPLLHELSGKIAVVHYRAIERNFLNQSLLLRFKEGIEFPVIDTLQIESQVTRKAYSQFMRWLKGQESESVRLTQTRKRYNLPLYPAHHALSDAIATAELFQAQIAHHYSPQDRIDRFWL